MLLGVLPRFASLFESLNAALPPTTELLMWLSEGLQSYWWAVLIGLIGAVVGARIYFGTAKGRRTADAVAVRIPYIGVMVRSLATARIARLLGVMLEARVPLLEALVLTKDSTSNYLYTRLMTRAVDAATRGESVSSVFSRSPLINASVSEAIRHGEKNGQIGPILSDMADFLDEENQVIVKTAMGILEPLILIVLGMVVGFIALSLFIPLFDLTATAGAK
jgi:type II secretory pathway component PulF